MNERPLAEAMGESYGFLKAYVEKRIEVMRLEVIEKIALTASTLILLGAMSFIFFFILGLLSVALALYLSPIVGSTPVAFLILAGFYALVAILIFALRKRIIIQPVLDMVIRVLDSDQEL